MLGGALLSIWLKTVGLRFFRELLPTRPFVRLCPDFQYFPSLFRLARALQKQLPALHRQLEVERRRFGE